MQFAREKTDALTISAYSAAEVRVGEHRLAESFILTPDTVIRNWPPRQVRDLSKAHLERILELSPDIVVLGTGIRLVFPDAALVASMTGRGIGVEVMDNGAACRTYNVLVHEGRRVAAGILLDVGKAAD